MILVETSDPAGPFPPQVSCSNLGMEVRFLIVAVTTLELIADIDSN